MTVLVTGGAGAVGSHMSYALADAGERVVLDNLSTGVRANVAPDAVLPGAIMGDAALVKRLIAEHGIDAVIRFAGLDRRSGVSPSGAHPTMPTTQRRRGR